MSSTWTYIACFVVLLLLVNSSQAVTEILIGAILSSPGNGNTETIEEEAIKLAIDQINDDIKTYRGIKLRGLIRYADRDDDFDNIEKVNSLLGSNISILIGPMETSAVLATHPLCLRARVPQIAPLTTIQTSQVDNFGTSYLLRMSPTKGLRAKAMAEIVKHYNWTTMAILGYQDSEVSKGLSAFRLIAYENEWNVVAAGLVQPHPKVEQNIIATLELKNLQSSERTRIAVVFCPAWAVSKLIQLTQSPLKKQWTWIFSDFGNQESDLLGTSGVVSDNMRGLLGIKPSFSKGARFKQFKHAWTLRVPHMNFTVTAGRVYDSVLVAAEGIKGAINSRVDLSKPPTYLGFCGSVEQQPENANGKELAKHLREVTVEGVMGKIQANDSDSLGSANFDVINLRADGEHKVGEWNENLGLQMYKNETPVWPSNSTEIPKDVPNILKGKTLKIATILAQPFVMKKGEGVSSDNETQEFEGLTIDILEEMRKELGFNYKIHLVQDGKFGVKDESTKKWNGVVKEIIDKKADMSIAPMTISSDRKSVLDFTQPYMTFGLAYIIRVKDVKVNYFRFLSPFNKSLWIALFVLIMVISVFVWLCSLLSPWGYYGRILQAESMRKVDPEVLKEAETLSLSNSIWSSWKAYVRQGAEHPNSWSGRIMVSVFWFAVMIINATYTANLAAYLTVSRMQTPIDSIFDLADQTQIQYGTLKDSQLQTFFQNTDVPSYLVMGQFMEHRGTWMPSYKAAINRTMAGDFAFIADRPILDYVSREEDYCGKLKVTGGFGNIYGYGFAFNRGSPYTALFNVELFRLQRDFIISSLTHKWYKEKVKCEMMDNLEEQMEQGSTVQKMSIQSMLGVFILLAISVVGGLFIMIMEWIYTIAKRNRKGKKWCRKVKQPEPVYC